MRLKPFLIGLFGWAALALFSVIRYPAILRGQCYFQASWIFCNEQLTTPLKILSFLLIVGSLASIGYSGYAAYRTWRNGEGMSLVVQKYGWLYIALALLVVPFGSGDTSYYFSAGKTIAEGKNPYIDNWTLARPFVGKNHLEPVSEFSYGPLTAQLFRVVYLVSNDNPALFFFIWKIVSAIGVLLCGWLTWKVVGRLDAPKDAATWLVFWVMQPLLVFEAVSSGHFDSIWVVFLLLAVLAAMSRRWWVVFPLICVGIWIKFIPLLTIPFFALWWWQDTGRETWLRQVGQAAVSIVLGAMITVISWFPFWQGFRVFKSIILQSKWAVSSWFADIYYTLQPLSAVLFHERSHWMLTRAVHGLLLLVLGYFLWPYMVIGVRLIFKKTTLTAAEFVQFMCVGLLCYLCLWQKSFWPWYPLWLLPFGLIVFEVTKNKTWGLMWSWLAVAPLGWYGVWLANWLIRRTDAGNELWFWWVFVLLVWPYPLYHLYKLRKQSYHL